MSQPLPHPGWYPDPSGSGASRWWDGQGWRDSEPHAPPPSAPAPGEHRAGPSLHEQPVLVVARKTKLIEMTREYAVLDGQGRRIGAVVQVGRSAAGRAVGLVSRFDRYLAHRLEVRDTRGPVLVLTRPATIGRSRVQVSRPDGTPIGEIVRANIFGRIRFDLVAGGQLLGAVQAENWRASDFAVLDGAGTEVARLTKQREGLVRALLTTAGSYVVHVHFRLPEPLASLVIASALTVGRALERDD